MERTFIEELVYNYNKSLKDGDLEKLDKLSFEYDVFNRLKEVFSYDFETIVNYLVLDELPYSIASKLLINDENVLFDNFIKLTNGSFVASSNYGKAIIDEHVNRINKLLKYES